MEVIGADLVFVVAWVVRKAYRQKVLETHPDKLVPDASELEKQEAEDQFRRVSLSLLRLSFPLGLCMLTMYAGTRSFRGAGQCRQTQGMLLLMPLKRFM